jgi:uncharacterized protein YbcI
VNPRAQLLNEAFPAQAGSDPRLRALSAGVTRLVGDFGRSPTPVTSWRLDDDCVVTTVEEFMSPAEHVLVEAGEARLVSQLRSAFSEAIADEYVRVAEEALGRTVIAHRSEVICAADTCLEIFVLAQERSRGASPLRGVPAAPEGTS